MPSAYNIRRLGVQQYRTHLTLALLCQSDE
jgi:hypothetical protein